MTLRTLEERVTRIEKLLGVANIGRAEFVASLSLGYEGEAPEQRLARLRLVRRDLMAAEPADDADLAWKMETVDRAILANANYSEPEPQLASLIQSLELAKARAAAPIRDHVNP